MQHTPTPEQTAPLRDTLEVRLAALIDLDLTLKHVHWNVTGPNFISVHEMLDEFVAKVRPMSDAVAERIRTLGGVAVGTPQAIVDIRHWKDYDIGEGDAIAHLRSLRSVFQGVIEDHRAGIEQAGEVDPVTEDLLIAQTAELELMEWFVRSFLTRRDGSIDDRDESEQPEGEQRYRTGPGHAFEAMIPEDGPTGGDS